MLIAATAGAGAATAGVTAEVAAGEAAVGAAERSLLGALEEAATAVIAAGCTYPRVLDPRTGQPILYPGSGLTKVPVADRVPWGGQERGAFIKEWYDRGFQTPQGGWRDYDIHHIKPREYGGNNDFHNLVPVPRSVHEAEFNAWWRDYK